MGGWRKAGADRRARREGQGGKGKAEVDTRIRREGQGGHKDQTRGPRRTGESWGGWKRDRANRTVGTDGGRPGGRKEGQGERRDGADKGVRTGQTRGGARQTREDGWEAEQWGGQWETHIHKVRYKPTIFTKLDIKQAYHRVCMAMGHEYKTAFKTCYGLFEYPLMLFGLTNARAQFQFYMQNIFGDLLDILVVIYLDDILIFSKTLEKHIPVVRKVLQQFKSHGLYAKESKCQFHCQSVDFFGMIVSAKGLEMC